MYDEWRRYAYPTTVSIGRGLLFPLPTTNLVDILPVLSHAVGA